MLSGMHTQGFVTQDSANTDLQLFIGATTWKDTNNNATYGSGGEGSLYLSLASTLAGSFYADLTAFFHRIGMYASPANTQEQFGTAASVPGPTTVANTSDALGIVGFPPILAAQLPTLSGPFVGPIPKGMQINSVDVIYEIDTVAATVASVGLTKTTFANTAAPVITSLIVFGANGLPKTTNTAGQASVTNVAVANPAMITDNDAQCLLHVGLTAGSGGTIKFYGVVVKCSYNLN